jgi:hypothetical protein
MSDRPAHFNPDAPTEDYIPLAAAASGFAVLLGTALIGLALLGVRGLVAQAAPTPTPDPVQPAGLLLLAGTLGGVLAAGFTAWALLAPLPLYRRGGLSMVSAFTTFVAALLLAPVNHYLGLAGLAMVIFLAAVGCWALGRRLGRLRGAP